MPRQEYAVFLSEKHSKAIMQAEARRIQANPSLVQEVLAFIDGHPAELAWRAAWLLDMLADLPFDPPKGYADRLIQHLSATRHVGFARCMLRAVAGIKVLSEAEEGALANACFGWLDQEGIGVGMQGIAIETLMRICLRYPELWSELALRLEVLKATCPHSLLPTLRRAYETYRTKIAPQLNAHR